jgi:hypothetical protein
MRKKFNLKVLALLGASVVFAPNLARAETCHDEIARLQKLLDQAKDGDVYIEDLPESNFATSHHQPTPASIAKAKAEARQKAADLLTQARQQNAEGHEADCVKTLRPIIFPPK